MEIRIISDTTTIFFCVDEFGFFQAVRREHTAGDSDMTVPRATDSTVLNNLTDSLSVTTSALRENAEHIVPQPEGISLFDVKNDLLLSYLQNLVFLILFRLRSASESDDDAQTLQESVTQKLVELRIYLEKGVRPLEAKLKYQIDSVLRAAENAKVSEKKRNNDAGTHAAVNGAEDSASGSDSEEEIEDPAYAANSVPEQNTAGPRLLQQMSKVQPASRTQASTKSSRDGVYRPPRIAPTTMPSDPDTRTREPRKHRSQIMNEYIDEEMSSVPRAQPSIGSNNTILQSGRSGLGLKDREKERERTEYEEKHFTRLPGESKAEKRKARARGEGGRKDVFGGEDWSGLGGLGDRVSRSVSGGGREGLLKRREKRRATEDGPRGDGRELGIGESFDKRRRILEGREGRRRKGR